MKVSKKEYEDLLEYKDYPLMFENWMMDMHDTKVKQSVIDAFQPVTVKDNYFSEDEIKWMYGYMFSRTGRVRHNANGTVFASLNLEGVYRKFKDRFDEILPGAENSPVVGGNFFLTLDQYGLHNDSTREGDWQNTLERTPINAEMRKYVPWRNIIIPLWTNPDNVKSDAVFFKQRHVDYAHVYNHGVIPGEETATTYPTVKDHSTIDFHLLDRSKQDRELNALDYDKEHYDEYLYYTPYKRLAGLEQETTCEWKPGCPIVFDAVQLHATNKGTKDKQWRNKLGLLLCFLREV